MKIIYSSNNSGGDWWLTDENWKDLEKAGWKVDWIKDQKNRISSVDLDGRWLGALATNASKEFDDIESAILEFEEITGANAEDEGCPCCGSPHSFYEE